MASSGSRSGAGHATILMAVAFLSIGGFLFWLNIAARTEGVEVVEGPEANPATASAVLVSAEVLGADPSAQIGEFIRVEDVVVAGGVGATAFWTNLLNRPDPFLVHMDEAVAATGTTVGVGDQVTIVGSVLVMSDSIADAWVAAGSISDGQKFEVTFASSFMEIMDLMVVRVGGDGN